MSVSDAVIVGVFGLWAVASASVQIRRPPLSKLRRIDALQLLPVWKLFAPRPTTVDHHVEYRAWDASGLEATSWTLLSVPRDRRTLDAVLNTQRRARKALRSSAKYLVKRRSSRTQAQLAATPSYLLLLGAAKHEATRNPRICSVQFRIKRVSGYYLRATTLPGYESERHWL
jgi:Family of unknown function (DUF5819)